MAAKHKKNINQLKNLNNNYNNEYYNDTITSQHYGAFTTIIQCITQLNVERTN